MHLTYLKKIITLLGIAFFCFSAAPGHSEEKTKETLTNETCRDCHTTLSPGIDPKVFKETAHGDLSCTDCHADVTEIPHADKLSRVDCAVCHGDVDAEFSKSIHAELAQKGLSEFACRDCHGSHKIRPASDPESKIAKKNVPRTCGKCHTGIYEDFVSSVHGKL